MNGLAKRIDRLERASGRRDRLIVVWIGSGHTDSDVERAIEAKGIRKVRGDKVVCFRTVYEERDGRDIPANFEPDVTLAI